jgi:hypothetical protein
MGVTDTQGSDSFACAGCGNGDWEGNLLCVQCVSCLSLRTEHDTGKGWACDGVEPAGSSFNPRFHTHNGAFALGWISEATATRGESACGGSRSARVDDQHTASDETLRRMLRNVDRVKMRSINALLHGEWNTPPDSPAAARELDRTLFQSD